MGVPGHGSGRVRKAKPWLLYMLKGRKQATAVPQGATLPWLHRPQRRSPWGLCAGCLPAMRLFQFAEKGRGEIAFASVANDADDALARKFGPLGQLYCGVHVGS